MTILLNDLHFGATRKGGTTPASQQALKDHLIGRTSAHLAWAFAQGETHALVLGDMLDDFVVSPADLAQVYKLWEGWLNLGCRLTLVAGNHDDSARADKLSAFGLLCLVLRPYGGQVRVVGVNEEAEVRPGFWVIAHCNNQQIFDARLESYLAYAKENPGPKLLGLHCNFDNPHAQQADHSLDLSAEMARRLEDEGVKILLAHEHQPRTVRNVRVLGNQFASSVSDCLGNRQKFSHRVSDSLEVLPVTVWTRDAAYAEVNWRNLGDLGTDRFEFVKVVGTAPAEDAAEALRAVSEFRRTCPSSVFIVNNAIGIEGAVDANQITEQATNIQRFDLMGFVRDQMTPTETLILNKLLEN